MNAKPRVWAWAPCWYWFGWRTLNPIHLGGDEHGRRTLMLGWTITGRVIIALWQSYEPDAYDTVDEFLASFEDPGTQVDDRP